MAISHAIGLKLGQAIRYIPIATKAQRLKPSAYKQQMEKLDIVRMEKAGTFRGAYHVLGGKISPINGIGADDLRIGSLEARMDSGAIKEIILALGMDVEGDATSHYMADRLRSRGVLVTRIAFGIPAGSGLEYADEITLSRALEGRTELK